MKQYNQHPDIHWCTYYASATNIAYNTWLELSLDDLKAISNLMVRYKRWWRSWYTMEDASKVVINYIKWAYNKNIWVAEVDTRKVSWKQMIVIMWKIDANYVFDIKDWKLEKELPKKWEWHARCIYKDDNWIWHLVENFLWILPYNDIIIGKELPKWISNLWYVYYNK